MTQPTAKEINVHDSLYERHACKVFLGKSIEEAEALFRENACSYYGDLMWMGPVAFRFYVTAAMRYLRSEASSGDSDAINCFVGVLEFRLEHESAELVPAAAELASICDFIVQHYDRFDLNLEIYGDVRARCRMLQQTFLQMASRGQAV